jgi:ABC-type amino acid transport system permease subunit
MRRALYALGLFVVASVAFYGVFSAVEYPWNWSGVWQYREQFFHGWLSTMGLLLGCFEGAYLAEIFRGGVESISASQREAARAVGFDTRRRPIGT